MKLYTIKYIFFSYLFIFVCSTYSSINIKNCSSCMSTLQEAHTYINQLEKTCKLLHDDVSKWMKLYSDEISNKAAAIEKNMSWYMDYVAKFITLEQKVCTNSHPKK